MAGIRRRLGVVVTALLAATMAVACDTKAPFAPSLPAVAGFRVDDGVLKLWTGTPCEGVTRVWVLFDAGTTKGAEQIWTAPPPGVRLEYMDLLTTAGETPPTNGPLEVETPLPADYDWTKAATLHLMVYGPTAFGALVDVRRVLRESADHPSDTYLFGHLGWMNAADIQRENQKSLLTICTPDPN
jgi:hypothetical protein